MFDQRELRSWNTIFRLVVLFNNQLIRSYVHFSKKLDWMAMKVNELDFNFSFIYSSSYRVVHMKKWATTDMQRALNVEIRTIFTEYIKTLLRIKSW